MRIWLHFWVDRPERGLIVNHLPILHSRCLLVGQRKVTFIHGEQWATGSSMPVIPKTKGSLAHRAGPTSPCKNAGQTQTLSSPVCLKDILNLFSHDMTAEDRFPLFYSPLVAALLENSSPLMNKNATGKRLGRDGERFSASPAGRYVAFACQRFSSPGFWTQPTYAPSRWDWILRTLLITSGIIPALRQKRCSFWCCYVASLIWEGRQLGVIARWKIWRR